MVKRETRDKSKLTRGRSGDKIIFESLNIMKPKNLGIGLVIIAGVLVWQGILIIRTESKSPVSSSETVAETQQSVGDVSVEVNYLAGKSDENKIVFEISLNTHSVDLEEIDFQKTVILQKDGQSFPPFKVEIFGSGHHRSAELSFSKAGVPLKIVFLGTPEVGRKEFEFEKLPATSSYSP